MGNFCSGEIPLVTQEKNFVTDAMEKQYLEAVKKIPELAEFKVITRKVLDLL
jgi:hypothetical protein